MKALISLKNTNKLVEHAKELRKFGFELIVTSESEKILSNEGVNCILLDRYLGISNAYGFPPTLHPRIEFELTSDAPEKIDLVYVNPYGLDDGVDVGGHTLLALGIKGSKIVLSDSEGMDGFLSEMVVRKGRPSDLYLELSKEKALRKIIKFYENLQIKTCAKKLLSGENPYQAPAYMVGNLLGVKGDDFGKTSTDEYSLPCYTNIADADSLMHCYALLHKAFQINFGAVPYISIVAKHGNPCGISISWNDRKETIEKCLWTDPVSIWGGEFLCNFNLDLFFTELLCTSDKRKTLLNSASWMFDVIMAPDLNLEASELLMKRKATKIFRIEDLGTAKFPDFHKRDINGGYMIQPYPNFILDLGGCISFGEAVEDMAMADTIIAWAASYSSFMGGNEIAIAKDGSLVAVGGGPSTVLAAEIAVYKAKKLNLTIKDSVFAADAFLPFLDAAEVVVREGATRALMPSGGKNEEKVVKYLKEKLKSVYLIDSPYRGFIRH